MVVPKHLKSGSECPPFSDKTKLRLYGMHFCPYVQRAKLVLAAKNIPYEEININLVDRPEWYLKKNPPGQVPGLEWIDPDTNEQRFLAESLVVCDYLDEIYPEHRLHPQDPYLKAKQRMLIERCSNLTTAFYKVFREGSATDELIKQLLTYENSLTGKFFGGDSPTMLDYMMWPWMERLPLLNEKGFDINNERKQFPKLFSWIESMNSLKAVKDIQVPTEKQREFMASYKQGKPNYDLE